MTMSAKPDSPYKLTKEDTAIGKFINSFQSTLRRMSDTLGFGISPDGKRNYNTIFGYGETLEYSDYYGMYRRSALGHAIVSRVAHACWNEQPIIKQGEDNEILEDEINQLDKIGFFRAMERADVLNRIGNFSVLLIGVPDGMDLDKPLGTANDLSGLYFNPYNYDGIEVLEWDNNPESKRWGKPEKYQLQTTSFGEKNKDVKRNTVVVHWSRVVHMAEGALDSSVEGASALEPVWNKLIDLMKITGGAGEAYFRNARLQRSLETTGDAAIDSSSAAMSALKENVDNFDNAWDSTLRLQNMTAKNMQVQMISPRDSFDSVVEEISGNTSIPIRILTGKGGGQLAGSEDRASWNGFIADRRESECNTYLMQALEIMASAGLIELPEDAVIEWPAQASLNEKEQSEVNKTKAETLNIITDVMAKPVGDEMDKDAVKQAVGLEDIEIDEAALEDIDIGVEGLPEQLPPPEGLDDDDEENQQTSSSD
jgi:uncharacterized protein